LDREAPFNLDVNSPLSRIEITVFFVTTLNRDKPCISPKFTYLTRSEERTTELYPWVPEDEDELENL